MAYALRDGVSLCIAGNRTVFLDLDADRYFGLPLSSEAAFQRLILEADPCITDREALAPLVGQGLLVEQQSGRSLRDRVARVPRARTQLDLAGEAAGFLSSLFALAYLAQTRWLLSRRGAPAMLRRARRAKARLAGSCDPVSDDARKIAEAFDRAGLFVTAHDQCLARSLALSACLSADRFAHELVIGVKMRPFDAHCWVQIGQTILNDTVERTQMFTPILAL